MNTNDILFNVSSQYKQNFDCLLLRYFMNNKNNIEKNQQMSYPHRSHQITNFEFHATAEINIIGEIKRYLNNIDFEFFLIDNPDPKVYGKYCTAPGYYKYLPTMFGERNIVSSQRITDPSNIRTYAALKAIKEFLDENEHSIWLSYSGAICIVDGETYIDIDAKELLSYLKHINELEEHICWINNPDCQLGYLYDKD